jgi:hypothetical protein
LLWSAFLPLGTRWAVGTSTTDRSTVFSSATMAVLVQVWLVYGLNAFHKLRGNEWLAGDAVYEIFGVGQLTILIGPALADFHGLLLLLQYIWLGTLVASPLLLLSTTWLRTTVASLLIGGHIGMLFTMKIGIFPLISVVSLVLFYPPVVWEWLTARANNITRPIWATAAVAKRRARLCQRWGENTVRYDGGLLDSHRYYRPVVTWGKSVWTWVVPAIILAGVLVSAGQSAGVMTAPESVNTSIEVAEIDQSWRMFAPDPMNTEEWYVVVGVLANGSQRDIYDRGEVTFSRPKRVDKTYRTERWRKYLHNVRTVSNTNHRSYYADYLCRRWNRSQDTAVKRIGVYAVTRYGRSGNTSMTSRELLATEVCD